MSSTYINIPAIGNTGPAGPQGPAGPAGGSPGGSNKQIQFNDSSSFGGSSGFQFDKTLISVASGHATSTASGTSSVAMGWNAVASGNFASSAFGLNTTSSGQSAFTANNSNAANGQDAAAFNTSNTATGTSSFATGNSTVCTGLQSFTTGMGSLAHGDSQAVFGQFNVAVGTPGAPASTDEIFTIGNGANSGARATAFAVLRDGSIKTSSNIIPTANNTLSLGDSSHKFLNAYVSNIGIDGDIYISLSAKNLLDNGSTPVVDWNLLNLNDNSNLLSVDWANRTLNDPTGVSAVDYDARSLNNSGAAPTLNWEVGWLVNGATTVLDWVTDNAISMAPVDGVSIKPTGGDVVIQPAAGNTSIYSQNGSVQVQYTPANSAFWDGDPTTLKEAIDRIAAVVGNGTPIP